MDGPAHHAPYAQFLFRTDQDVTVTRPAGAQQNALGETAELLDAELAIDHYHHDLAIRRHLRPIHDQQIAVVDAEARHRASRYSDKESGLLMRNEMLIKAQAFL
jgi:predicted transcriptional regulator